MIHALIVVDCIRPRRAAPAQNDEFVAAMRAGLASGHVASTPMMRRVDAILARHAAIRFCSMRNIFGQVLKKNDVQTCVSIAAFITPLILTNTRRPPFISQDDGDLEAHAFDELAPALKLADALQMPEVWNLWIAVSATLELVLKTLLE
jgi:hypothetical protein